METLRLINHEEPTAGNSGIFTLEWRHNERDGV